MGKLDNAIKRQGISAPADMGPLEWALSMQGGKIPDFLASNRPGSTPEPVATVSPPEKEDEPSFKTGAVDSLIAKKAGRNETSVTPTGTPGATGADDAAPSQKRFIKTVTPRSTTTAEKPAPEEQEDEKPSTKLTDITAKSTTDAEKAEDVVKPQEEYIPSLPSAKHLDEDETFYYEIAREYSTDELQRALLDVGEQLEQAKTARIEATRAGTDLQLVNQLTAQERDLQRQYNAMSQRYAEKTTFKLSDERRAILEKFGGDTSSAAYKTEMAQAEARFYAKRQFDTGLEYSKDELDAVILEMKDAIRAEEREAQEAYERSMVGNEGYDVNNASLQHTTDKAQEMKKSLLSLEVMRREAYGVPVDFTVQADAMYTALNGQFINWFNTKIAAGAQLGQFVGQGARLIFTGEDKPIEFFDNILEATDVIQEDVAEAQARWQASANTRVGGIVTEVGGNLVNLAMDAGIGSMVQGFAMGSKALSAASSAEEARKVLKRGQSIGSLGSMWLSALGASAKEARDWGEANGVEVSTFNQTGYGILKASIEVQTERMFDGLAGAFGAGEMDDLIEALAQGMTKSRTGQMLIKFALDLPGEALEEVVSALCDPIAYWAIGDKEALKQYKNADYWRDVGHAAVVGFAMSLLLSGPATAMNLVSGRESKANSTDPADVILADDEYTEAREGLENVAEYMMADEPATQMSESQKVFEETVTSHTEATVLDPIATFISQNSDLTAEECRTQAALINKLLNGQRLSSKELRNALMIKNPAVQAIFTQMTGIEIPAKTSPSQLRELFQSAADAAKAVKAQQAALAQTVAKAQEVKAEELANSGNAPVVNEIVNNPGITVEQAGQLADVDTNPVQAAQAPAEEGPKFAPGSTAARAMALAERMKAAKAERDGALTPAAENANIEAAEVAATTEAAPAAATTEAAPATAATEEAVTAEQASTVQAEETTAEAQQAEATDRAIPTTQQVRLAEGGQVVAQRKNTKSVNTLVKNLYGASLTLVRGGLVDAEGNAINGNVYYDAEAKAYVVNVDGGVDVRKEVLGYMAKQWMSDLYPEENARKTEIKNAILEGVRQGADSLTRGEFQAMMTAYNVNGIGWEGIFYDAFAGLDRFGVGVAKLSKGVFEYLKSTQVGETAIDTEVDVAKIYKPIQGIARTATQATVPVTVQEGTDVNNDGNTGERSQLAHDGRAAEEIHERGVGPDGPARPGAASEVQRGVSGVEQNKENAHGRGGPTGDARRSQVSEAEVSLADLSLGDSLVDDPASVKARVVQPSTKEHKQLVDWAKSQGCSNVVLLAEDLVGRKTLPNGKTKKVTVNGAVRNGTLYLSLNSTKAQVNQILAHEMGHFWLESLGRFGEGYNFVLSQFESKAAPYVAALWDTYNSTYQSETSQLSEEQARFYILEEIFGDALGGINKAEQYGVEYDISGLKDIAREIATKYGLSEAAIMRSKLEGITDAQLKNIARNGGEISGLTVVSTPSEQWGKAFHWEISTADGENFYTGDVTRTEAVDELFTIIGDALAYNGELPAPDYGALDAIGSGTFMSMYAEDEYEDERDYAPQAVDPASLPELSGSNLFNLDKALEVDSPFLGYTQDEAELLRHVENKDAASIAELLEYGVADYLDSSSTFYEDPSVLLATMTDTDAIRQFSDVYMEAYKQYAGEIDLGDRIDFEGAVRERINTLDAQGTNCVRIRNPETRRIENQRLGKADFQMGKVSMEELRADFNLLNSDKEVAKLAEKVFSVAEQLGIAPSFVKSISDSYSDKKRYAGEYISGKVFLSLEKFNSKYITDQTKASAIVHEFIHAATSYAVSGSSADRANLSPEMQEAIKLLEGVYEDIKDDARYTGQYGLTNVSEMVAELSNPKFRTLLKDTRNLWNRLLDAIKTFFGIKQKNDLHIASKALDYMLDNIDFEAYKGSLSWKGEGLHATMDELYEDYNAAFKARNSEWCREVLGEIARQKGFSERGYHGTRHFDDFRTQVAYSISRFGYFATSSPFIARSYLGGEGPGVGNDGWQEGKYYENLIQQQRREMLYKQPAFEEALKRVGGHLMTKEEYDYEINQKRHWVEDDIRKTKEGDSPLFYNDKDAALIKPVQQILNTIDGKLFGKLRPKAFGEAVDLIRRAEPSSLRSSFIDFLDMYELAKSGAKMYWVPADNRITYISNGSLATPEQVMDLDRRKWIGKHQGIIQTYINTSGFLVINMGGMPMKDGSPRVEQQEFSDEVWSGDYDPASGESLIGTPRHAVNRTLFEALKLGNNEVQYQAKVLGANTKNFSDSLAHLARLAGYPGVIFRDAKDPGATSELIASTDGIDPTGVTGTSDLDSDRGWVDSDIYCIFDASRVKSADLATFEDDGKKVPIEKRFNTEETELRHSMTVEDDADEGNAPVFYSQMARTIDGIKQDKVGAASVVSYLRGRGVKAEEIKWSGIEDWLAGKKSVTKEELQMFAAGSMLEIEEARLGAGDTREQFETYAKDWFNEKYGSTDYVFDVDTEGDDPDMWTAFAINPANNEDEIVDGINSYDVSLNRAELARWQEHTLPGGIEGSYQELLFRMPDWRGDYSNRAMNAHWGDGIKKNAGVIPGVLAHARVQDMVDNETGEVMLFIEEIQSDWHNAGHKFGYTWDEREAAIEKIESEIDELDEQLRQAERAEDFSPDAINDLALKIWTKENDLDEARSAKITPDAPFRDNYTDFVLKRLLREAAEKGYGALAWTTAEQQSERWSDEFAEGYRIEYDQDMPKFLNKYGKKWGGKVTKTTIPNGETVWKFDIPGDMQQSILKEGQPFYSMSAENEPPHITSFQEENPFDAQKMPLEYELFNLMSASSAEAVETWYEELQNKHSYNPNAAPPIIPNGHTPPIPEGERKIIYNQLEALVGKYGALEAGELKARDVTYPKKVSPDEYTRRVARTAAEAQNIPDHTVDQISKLLLTGDGQLTYHRVTNAEAEKAANELLSKYGYDTLMRMWKGIVTSARVTKRDIVFGESLLIQLAKEGKEEEALDVLTDLAAIGTEAGQVVQAYSELKRLSPKGKLLYISKVVDRLNTSYKGLITKGKMRPILIDQVLAAKVAKAQSTKEIQSAMDELTQKIADQIPVTFRDKLNAWRYFAMLGNPRTHIRNVFGNAIFAPLKVTKDFVAAMGEGVAIRDKSKRSKNVGAMLHSRKSAQFRELAKEDFEVMKPIITGEGKYNPMSEIMKKRKIFGNERLTPPKTVLGKVVDKGRKGIGSVTETARRAVGDALEAEDAWFLKPYYVSALTQYLTNQGMSVEQLRSTKEGERVLNDARAYAILEAQKATYRDFSVVANAINQVKRVPGIGIFFDGQTPFTKTPINIMKRGIEYSPIELGKVLTYDLHQLSKGNMTANEVVDHIASGFTGSAVMLIGALMAKLGWLKGGQDKDKKKAAFDANMGEQSYSLRLYDGKVNYTVDWAAPGALPLFAGVVAYKLYENEDKLDVFDLVNASTLLLEPMLQLSMLDGINSTLSAVSYADRDEMILTLSTSILASYAGQVFPTLGGQIARSLDSERRANYVDKNSKVPAYLQMFFQQQIMGKTPGLEEEKMPYIDLWGRGESTEGDAGRTAWKAIENLLSPGYLNFVERTPVDNELERLYNELGTNSVLPSAAPKSFSVNNSDKYLTADEYVQFATELGQTRYSLLMRLINDADYQQLSDSEKAKAISYYYKYASAVAKFHLDPEYDLHGQGVWIEKAEAAYDPYPLIWEKAIAQIEKDR